MNITVLGLTNHDVNLKRMYQLYINDLSLCGWCCAGVAALAFVAIVDFAAVVVVAFFVL